MSKKKTKGLLMIFLCFCCVFIFNVTTANAAMVDEAEEYELGTEYRGHVNEVSSNNGFRAERYYRFSITEKSYVTLRASAYTANFHCSIYNINGKTVLNDSDFTLETNSVTGMSSGKQSRILSAGTYYLLVEGRNTDFIFSIQAEKIIKLEKGTIRSLKSPKKGQIEVKCKATSNAIGYRIQYSTDYRFKKKVKTVYTPTISKTIKGLKKGERYYVRVSPYTVYEDGTMVFGQNSYVKSVKVKK